MSQKNKYIITWIAHASEIIEADNIKEAMEIAKEKDRPSLVDFSLPTYGTNPEVDEYMG